MNPKYRDYPLTSIVAAYGNVDFSFMVRAPDDQETAPEIAEKIAEKAE